MGQFSERVLRAAQLDVSLYEEVEEDRGANMQAMAVVVLSAIASGIGSATQAGVSGLLIVTTAALIGWLIWAWLTYMIGTKLLPEPQTEADLGQLLRCIGFSSAPGLIRVLGIIPPLRGVVFFVASVWMLVAMVIAVRQALDYRSTLRAVGVCLIGWLVQILFFAIVFLLLGGGQIAFGTGC